MHPNTPQKTHCLNSGDVLGNKRDSFLSGCPLLFHFACLFANIFDYQRFACFLKVRMSFIEKFQVLNGDLCFYKRYYFEIFLSFF